MNTKKKPGMIALAAGLLVIPLVLAGCAAAAAETGADQRTNVGIVPQEDALAPPSAEYEEPRTGASDAGDADGYTDTDISYGSQQDRMIIKTAWMELHVGDVDLAINQVTQIATDNGGYLLSSQVWYAGEYKAATITIGVRAEQYETALQRLRDMAVRVASESSSGEDVTEEYVDLESRLRNLEATRDRIRTFLDQAQTVEEALTVNAELAQIEAEIEQVMGRISYLEGRSAYSTITIDLRHYVEPPAPTPTPTPTPEPKWSLGPTIDSAVATQISLLRGLAQMVTWVGIFLGPYIIILLVLILLFRGWLRRRRRTMPAKAPEAES
nr:DUF4349 domain-containing protein [Anaerolineae bacterium]